MHGNAFLQNQRKKNKESSFIFQGQFSLRWSHCFSYIKSRYVDGELLYKAIATGTGNIHTTNTSEDKAIIICHMHCLSRRLQYFFSSPFPSYSFQTILGFNFSIEVIFLFQNARMHKLNIVVANKFKILLKFGTFRTNDSS